METSKKMLNLGCGDRYHPEWTNVDFVSKPPHVMAHNIRLDLPFGNETFYAVYHSHVLEHFSTTDGESLIRECFRVLRSEGILRVVVPDLENIIRTYLEQLEKAIGGNKSAESNYDWILVELFDQVARNESGGEMAKYLMQEQIPNAGFVVDRIGNNYFELIRRNYGSATAARQRNLLGSARRFLSALLKRNKHFRYHRIGRFREGGDVHYHMYDRFSLGRLLLRCGFVDVQRKTAFESSVENWTTYGLDAKDGSVHAPLSLFMEARKPTA